MSRSVTVIGPTLALLALLYPSDARAQESDGNAAADAITWGYIGFEVTTATVAYRLFSRGGQVPTWQHVTLSLSPIVAGIGVGVLSDATGWNGDAGRATHGALWGALGGVLLGSALDGYLADRTLRMGSWAYTLGFTGAIGAAWLGATQVNPDTETPLWLALPGGVAFGGVIVGGLAALIMSQNGRHRRLGYRIWAMSVAAGVTAGLLIGSLSNPTTSDERSAELPVDDVAGRQNLPRSFMLTVPFTW